MKRISIFIIMGAVALIGCQRDKVSVYKAPKEAPSSAMPMMGMGQEAPMPQGGDSSGMGSGELPHNHPPIDNMNAPMGNMGNGELPPGHPPIDGNTAMAGNMGMSAPADRGIKWTAPKGWTEKPPSQMRVASFSAAGKNGQVVDISVVSLAGEAGGELSNVNRWRGQIELPPISEDALAKETKRIAPAGRKMLLADMVGEKPVIENKFKRRLVAVIYSHGGQSWFFKMVGEDSAVTENKPALMKFLENLKFADE